MLYEHNEVKLPLGRNHSYQNRCEVVLLVRGKCSVKTTKVFTALARDNLVVITQSEEGTVYLAEAPGSGMSFRRLSNSGKNLHSELNEMKYTMK